MTFSDTRPPGIKERVKRVLLQSPLFGMYLSYRHHASHARALRAWEASGGPAGEPPPHPIKQRVVREYGARFGLMTLIETGTYMGDMVYAMRRDFTRIISIELSPLLAAQVGRYFAREPHITILQGDSGQLIPGIVAGLTAPALFWLDGHYSHGVTARGAQDTPILQELTAILADTRFDHCLLLDDARAFGDWQDYPTLDAVRALVHAHHPAWTVAVDSDIIRITP